MIKYILCNLSIELDVDGVEAYLGNGYISIMLW